MRSCSCRAHTHNIKQLGFSGLRAFGSRISILVGGQVLAPKTQPFHIVNRIITEENLDKDETYKFINNAFRDGFVQSTGTAITKVLPPVSRFSPTGERTRKRDTVLEKLSAFFSKFWDISGGRFFKN